MIRKGAAHIQQEIKEFILMECKRKKIILSIDGCQIKTRRYLNCVAYIGANIVHLGLIREKKNSKAENMIDVVKERLSVFGISFQNILCFVSDSATNNIRMAKLLGLCHQRCIAHMINNVVNKFLSVARPKERYVISDEA